MHQRVDPSPRLPGWRREGPQSRKFDYWRKAASPRPLFIRLPHVLVEEPLDTLNLSDPLFVQAHGGGHEASRGFLRTPGGNSGQLRT